MEYSVQSVSNLVVTVAGPGGNKLVKPKAYLDLKEFQCLDSHGQIANMGSLAK